MTTLTPEQVESLQTEQRTWRQLLKQTDEAAMAAQDGWDYEDVTDLRDECWGHIAEIEADLAEAEGREYTAPEKVSDGDHVRVGDVEDALADLSELASDTDVNVADVLDAIADLSEYVSALYDELEGGE